jgi:glutamine amidotransferase
MSNTKIAIIDYGLGNVNAFYNIFQSLDIEVIIAKTELDLCDAKKLILPGVGSFDWAIQRLNNSGMRSKIDELVLKEKIPVLGVCVGMQMMAFNSEEGSEPGLGWIDASVKQFTSSSKFENAKIQKLILPHMGWNEILINYEHPIFTNLINPKFYFLHSYYFEPKRSALVASTTNYGISYPSVVISDNIVGVQFHPEKSHNWGIQLLKNFALW